MFLPVFEELALSPEDNALELFSHLVKQRGQAVGAFYFQRSRLGSEAHQPTETILAFDPFETIRYRAGRAQITHRTGATLEIQGDPFSVVAARVREFAVQADPARPFFQGGALGYFSYDSVRYLEPALVKGAGNLRALDEAGEQARYDAEFMLFGKAIIIDHERRKLFLMSGRLPILEDERRGNERVEADLKEFRAAVEALRGRSAQAHDQIPEKTQEKARDSSELPIESMGSMLGRRGYMDGVKKLKNHIRAGDIFQAVLSDKLKVPYTGDPLHLFRTLLSVNPAPYQFYFDSGHGVYLGASPEMLLSVRGDELETHPIAGTRPRGATTAEESRNEGQLLKSEKERAEHLMLVDLARNDVGRVSEPGTVRVEEYMKVKKFSGVMHLVSRVKGKLLKGSGALEALASCFPAGTLSGAPKIRAMQLLSEMEPEARGFYGGAVVAASFTGDLDSCISIRSIELDGKNATVQVGAGIVADSQPTREYDEITQKSSAARKALGAKS